MTQLFPDIEIYIKDPNVSSVLEWLKMVFDKVDASEKGTTTLITMQSSRGIEKCVVLPNAVKGGFASLWFKSGNTPWDTDHDCARAAFASLNQEVRCSTGGWETSNSESDETWLRIDSQGESMINWQT